MYNHICLSVSVSLENSLADLYEIHRMKWRLVRTFVLLNTFCYKTQKSLRERLTIAERGVGRSVPAVSVGISTWSCCIFVAYQIIYIQYVDIIIIIIIIKQENNEWRIVKD